MREVTGHGKAVQRVRVVTEPHTDYTRFAIAVTAGNVAAGEDIRWLPRGHAPEALPDDDWWLFDDRLVAWTVFERDGTALLGWAASTDEVLTRHYARIRDQLWARAIPHDDYVDPESGGRACP